MGGKATTYMKRTGLMGLALALALPMSAVTAASASTPRGYEFQADEYPVHVLGKFTKPQRFELAGGVVVFCREGTLNTGEEKAENPTRDSPTLLAHPTYTNCTVSGSKATVRTAGCLYRFHAVPPNNLEGSVDIACGPRKRIEVEPEGIPGCVITIAPAAALKGIEFKNENGKLRINAEVTVLWSASSECGFAVLEGGVSWRSSALLEGFNSLKEADHLEVSNRKVKG
jgi:hypothetical protein